MKRKPIWLTSDTYKAFDKMRERVRKAFRLKELSWDDFTRMMVEYGSMDFTRGSLIFKGNWHASETD